MLTLLLAAALQSPQEEIYTFDRGRYQVWMKEDQGSYQVTTVDRKLNRHYSIQNFAFSDPDPVLIHTRSIVVGLGNLRYAVDEPQQRRNVLSSSASCLS